MSNGTHDNAPQDAVIARFPLRLTEAAASLARYLRDNCAAMTVGMADRIGMVERAVEREKATPPDAVLARAAVQFLEMTHRAEKAEANEKQLRQEYADLAKQVAAERAEADRVKAEDELAAVHEALKACLRPETQTGTAIGDANRIGQAMQVVGAHLFRALPGVNVVERDLPLVVDEVLPRLRAEANPPRAAWRAPSPPTSTPPATTCRPSWARPRSRAAR